MKVKMLKIFRPKHFYTSENVHLTFWQFSKFNLSRMSKILGRFFLSIFQPPANVIQGKRSLFTTSDRAQSSQKVAKINNQIPVQEKVTYTRCHLHAASDSLSLSRCPPTSHR